MRNGISGAGLAHNFVNSMKPGVAVGAATGQGRADFRDEADTGGRERTVVSGLTGRFRNLSALDHNRPREGKAGYGSSVNVASRLGRQTAMRLSQSRGWAPVPAGAQPRITY